MPQSLTAAALDGLRVLDLSGPLGNYCGKLFADMGADVILVEPPSGTALRFEPPYIANTPGVERSLTYAYHNTASAASRSISTRIVDKRCCVSSRNAPIS